MSDFAAGLDVCGDFVFSAVVDFDIVAAFDLNNTKKPNEIVVNSEEIKKISKKLHTDLLTLLRSAFSFGFGAFLGWPRAYFLKI